MASSTVVDEQSGRNYTLDEPDDHRPGEPVTFLLNLHGGGSVGMWQHEYFPAYRSTDQYRLVIATPSAATKEPMRRWLAEADDAHLQNIVNAVVARYGRSNIRSFWLVGHSQGGMTANRLLLTPFVAARVDGWLSLSGGRIGPAERAPNAGCAPSRSQRRVMRSGLESCRGRSAAPPAAHARRTAACSSLPSPPAYRRRRTPLRIRQRPSCR
jgi:hypothetical protein